jgi:pentatricopeptide repeat protein
MILKKGMKPDKFSYNTVIYAYCRNGRMKEAVRILSQMKDSALVPNVVTYNTFVATYAADSLFVEAIDVIRYMIKQGCKPDQYTYNSIVDWYCKHNRQEEANSFVKNLGNIDPRVSKEEKSRLLKRMATGLP